MDHYIEPVVTTRPVRGREMQSKIVPTDILTTVSDGNLAPQQKKNKGKKGEVYHEGYIEGKMYMVPDSTLEAMKDIVNFRMRPRRSTRFKHQTSLEISDYDHFQGKLDELLKKIDDIEPILSPNESVIEKFNKKKQSSITSNETISTMTTSSGSEVTLDEKYVYHDINIESDKNIEPGIESDKNIEPEIELEEIQEPVVSLPMEPDIKQTPEPEPDEYRLRFLISGHIMNDHKPVYIIQQYEAESNIFDGLNADLSSYTEENNHNVSISGKFYKENILEESLGKPVALNLKSKKILINEETSRIYDKEFTNLFSFEDADVLLKGDFIKTESTQNITPLLSLGITHKPSKKSKTSAQGNTDQEKKNNTHMFNSEPPINILNCDLKEITPFSSNTTLDNSISYNSQSLSDHSQQQSERIVERSHFQTTFSTTESSQLDSNSLSILLNEEPTIYEYPHEIVNRKNFNEEVKNPLNTHFHKLVKNFKNKEIENNKNDINSQATTSKYSGNKQMVKQTTPLRKRSTFKTKKVNSYFKLFSNKNKYSNPVNNLRTPPHFFMPGKKELQLSTNKQILKSEEKNKNQIGKCVKLRKQHLNPEICKQSTGHISPQKKIGFKHPNANIEGTPPTEIKRYEDGDKDINSTPFITYM